jgi:hypothetical protein
MRVIESDSTRIFEHTNCICKVDAVLGPIRPSLGWISLIGHRASVCIPVHTRKLNFGSAQRLGDQLRGRRHAGPSILHDVPAAGSLQRLYSGASAGVVAHVVARIRRTEISMARTEMMGGFAGPT